MTNSSKLNPIQHDDTYPTPDDIQSLMNDINDINDAETKTIVYNYVNQTLNLCHKLVSEMSKTC